MSDNEMDKEWQAGKPARQRPQSTVAIAFSASLDELFKIDNSIADLDAAVHEKKQAVSSRTTELEELEARLKATEERLQKMGSTNDVPASPPNRAAASGVLDEKAVDSSTMSPTRPGTARSGKRDETAPVPGGLPPTPGASEGEEDQ